MSSDHSLFYDCVKNCSYGKNSSLLVVAIVIALRFDWFI